MPRFGEMLIAASAASTVREQDALASGGEVGESFAVSLS